MDIGGYGQTLIVNSIDASVQLKSRRQILQTLSYLAILLQTTVFLDSHRIEIHVTAQRPKIVVGVHKQSLVSSLVKMAAPSVPPVSRGMVFSLTEGLVMGAPFINVSRKQLT